MLWGKYFEHLYTKKEEDAFDKELYWKISEKVSGLFTNKYKEHIDTLAIWIRFVFVISFVKWDDDSVSE
jgi:hypothetical protein